MDRKQNRRGTHRRYSDRRVAALLSLYEILYHEAPGNDRDNNLLEALQYDYETDRAAFVAPKSSAPSELEIKACTGDWGKLTAGSTIESAGLGAVLNTHQEFSGALTLSKFKRPSIIDAEAWENLWARDLSAPATALLSVPIESKSETVGYLWLAMNVASREWSSHDRDLSEEVAALMAAALDKTT